MEGKRKCAKITIHKLAPPAHTMVVNSRKGEMIFMTSNNNYVNPNAKEAMKQFKMETAREVGVNLKEGYNGDLTSKQAGTIGGEMVRKMIKKYEENM